LDFTNPHYPKASLSHPINGFNAGRDIVRAIGCPGGRGMSLDERGIPQTKILIVDDEPAKVVLLVQMLEEEEFVNVCSVAGTHKATVAAQAPDEIDALATQVAELASRLKIADEPDIPDIATAEQAREEYWEARQFSIKNIRRA
jgi:hypothetical protein